MALQLAPTLLDSFDWLTKCPTSWRDRAYNDMKNTLGRVYGSTTPEMQAGIDFENLVYRLSASNDYANIVANWKDSKHLLHCVQRVHDFIYQKTVFYNITVDGVAYFFKCKMDAWSPTEIIDIKTTSNFRGDSQYLTKWQHRLYPLASGVHKFTYLVAEWEDLARSKKIQDIHEVKYSIDTQEEIKVVTEQVTARIREFIDFINYDEELKRLYYTKYNKVQ